MLDIISKVSEVYKGIGRNKCYLVAELEFMVEDIVVIITFERGTLIIANIAICTIDIVFDIIDLNGLAAIVVEAGGYWTINKG